MTHYNITGVVLDASDGKLRVHVQIVDSDGQTGTAELPQRELSTLLPRTILLGDEKKVDQQLLSIINSTLIKLITGRAVRIWEYKEKRYCGFLSWGNITCEPANAMNVS